MLTIISGVGLLLVTLAGFSLFSMKAPKALRQCPEWRMQQLLLF